MCKNDASAGPPPMEFFIVSPSGAARPVSLSSWVRAPYSSSGMNYPFVFSARCLLWIPPLVSSFIFPKVSALLRSNRSNPRRETRFAHCAYGGRRDIGSGEHIFLDRACLRFLRYPPPPSVASCAVHTQYPTSWPNVFLISSSIKIAVQSKNSASGTSLCVTGLRIGTSLRYRLR